MTLNNIAKLENRLHDLKPTVKIFLSGYKQQQRPSTEEIHPPQTKHARMQILSPTAEYPFSETITRTDENGACRHLNVRDTGTLPSVQVSNALVISRCFT